MKITLPFKPHVLALICSAGLCAASGVMYVKSRAPQTPAEPAPITAPQAPDQPATVATAVTLPENVATPPMTPATATTSKSFTTAQIDQWVAPIALYPDALLSQVLMAATYPANVTQAVQWSHDNPMKQGDAAIQAVSGEPWDASVKSLVAFPQLMALMGENPQWVQNLGDAFLAQPQDVMDAVQRLRKLAQQTGSLKSTVEQKVVITKKKSAPVKEVVATEGNTSAPIIEEPEPTVITIEPTNPDVVYIPNYNPTVVYGSWANTAYPPVYLPPPAGEPFVDSFVRGFGYSMGVATTYALFSSIDWDDDHYHHDDDDHHHDDNHHNHDDDYRRGNGWQHNGDNININVNNFNRITGEHRTNRNMTWQHNPNYRDGVPYHDQNIAQHFHQTNVSGGLSATPQTRDSQRLAAASQFQQRTATTRDTQRQAAIQRFNEAEHYGDYANTRDFSRRQPLTQQQKDSARQRYQSASPEQRQAFREKLQSNPLNEQQRDAVRQRVQSATPEQRQAFKDKIQQRPLNQQQQNNARQRIQSASPEQRQVFQERLNNSNRAASFNNEQRSAIRERLSERGARRLER